MPKKKNITGVPCPNKKCDAKFVFDWCYYGYLQWVKGKTKKTKEILSNNDFDIEYYCPKCGEYLSRVKESDEESPMDNEKWKDIDWEDTKYSVYLERLNKK